MTAGSRGFGRRNSPNSRQGNTVQHDTQQALAFINQGKLQEAEAIYKKLIQQGAGDHLAFGNLGAICTVQGRNQEATTFLRQALAIKTDFPDAWANLGIVLKRQGNLDAAVSSCRQALDLKPNYPEALTNLGSVFREQGNLAAAVSSHRKAISSNPDYALGHLNLALALLLAGNYDDGWKEYNWRFAEKIRPHAHPKLEEWNGSNHIPGEQLTVISEQGMGDTLQFMRYIPYLKTMGVHACFCAQPNLRALIQTSGITTRLYDFKEANALTTGKWIPLLSLPAHLNVKPDNPVTNKPYIKAAEQQILHWKQKLALEKRPIIGINWQGSQLGTKLAKSLPLVAFAPILEKTDASLLSLQKGDGSEQMADCPFHHRFVACQEEINQTWDFLETAAMVANCDLIITSDTALAHLAGGMGQPTWLLLKKVPDWRWGMEGDTTFWYPSMRLFRQRERGNWAEVMERVARALEALPGDQNYN